MREYFCPVSPEDAGRPIKRVIRSRLGLSHRQFVLLKYQGEMLLDGQPVRADKAVGAGQIITVRLAEKDRAAEGRPGPLNILYQDEDILVLDKPAPLPCQASSRQEGDALEHYLAWRFRERAGAYTFRPVNRLDKGTSGLMAVAMNAHAQMVLSACLHTPAFRREYRAIVSGSLPEPEGLVEAPIRKKPGPTVCREVHPEGRPAVTRYKVLRSDGARSLVQLVLATGRTHQIRVHLAHLGCPVLGDYLYGAEDRERLPGRFALHSSLLRLPHPQTGEELEFASELPAEMTALLPDCP
jgi:23S rRNA pseudouridine1911/1915/1917 synthase